MNRERSPSVEPFIMIPKAVLARPDLNLSDKVVYGVICDSMRGKGISWPGTRYISDTAKINRGTVTRAITRLESVGLLKVDRGSGPGHVHVYRLPDAPDGSGLPAHQGGAIAQHQEWPACAPRCCASKPEVAAPVGLKKTRRKKKTKARAHSNDSPKPTDLPLPNDRPLKKRKRQQPDSVHQQTADYFCQRWSELHGNGAAYPFDGGRDGASVKRLLKAVGGDPDQAAAVIDAYLTHTDEWLAERGHTLSIFVSNAQLPRCISRAAKATGANRHQRTNDPSPPPELPIIADARRAWPEDVAAHADDYAAIAEAVEAGRLNRLIVKKALAAKMTGPAFRGQHFPKCPAQEVTCA